MQPDPIVGINLKCPFLKRDISNEIDIKYKEQGKNTE